MRRKEELISGEFLMKRDWISRTRWSIKVTPVISHHEVCRWWMIKVTWLIISGLTTLLSTLKETMLPNIGPKNVADTNVRISGQYDPCLYGVNITLKFDLNLKTLLNYRFLSVCLNKGGVWDTCKGISHRWHNSKCLLQSTDSSTLLFQGKKLMEQQALVQQSLCQ